MGIIVQFTISEAELDELERGSPAPLLLNFALFFGGAGLSQLGAVLTLDFAKISPVMAAVAVGLCVVEISGALVLAVLWRWFNRTPHCAHRIRSRLTDDVHPIQLTEVAAEDDG
jgi:hypothetical protein